MNFDAKNFNEVRMDGISIDGLCFTNCTFERSAFGMDFRTQSAESTRAVLTNVELLNGTVLSSSVGPIRLRRSLVAETCLTGCQFHGTLFDEVKISGDCGKLDIGDLAGQVGRNSKLNRAIVQMNASSYADVAWALDISDAVFTDYRIRGVPGELIRVNGSDQVVVNYQAFCNFTDLGRTAAFTNALRRVHANYEMNFVVIATKSPQFDSTKEYIQMLRRSRLLLT